ncbi:MAG: hypothetical protein A3D28_06110 [Omnitrophica bacterium RIFCSPHIGHO2_02_FULL_63_14]|nr:MAG: hypothetical protein A3D28_06110 [Omnitrophica bacterium RIFCSPHIGHO2_02_FULL_63_14]
MNNKWALAGCAVMLIVGLRVQPAAAVTEPTPGSAERFRYTAKGRRDPFVALVRDGRIVAISAGGHAESSTPVLYGVLWDSGGNSIALINDGEARVGDMVGDYRVVEIREDAVVLANGGEPVVIRLAFETPPKPAPGAATGGGQP